MKNFVSVLLIVCGMAALASAETVNVKSMEAYDQVWVMRHNTVVEKLDKSELFDPVSGRCILCPPKQSFCPPQNPDPAPYTPPPFEADPNPVPESPEASSVFDISTPLVILAIVSLLFGVLVGAWVTKNSQEG